MTRPDTREDIMSLAAADVIDWNTKVRANTDDAMPSIVLGTLRYCALHWVPEARIIGNIRACDIVRALDCLAAAPTPPAAEGFVSVPIDLYEALTAGRVRDPDTGLGLVPAAEAPGQEPVAEDIKELLSLLDAGVRCTGSDNDSNGEIELFDIEEANQAMQDAATFIRSALVSAPTKQEPVAELLPIFLAGGIGDRLSAAMTDYLAAYAYDPNPDEGFADHELTEFERGMMEDFLAGAIGDIGVNAILQEAARAVSAPPTYADAEAKGFERGISAAVVTTEIRASEHNMLQNANVIPSKHHAIRDDLYALATAIRSLASPAPKGET